MHSLHFLIFIGFVIVSTISAFVSAYRMRRKIKKALGNEPTSVELTSLSTWMKVADAEEKARKEEHGGTLGPPL